MVLVLILAQYLTVNAYAYEMLESPFISMAWGLGHHVNTKKHKIFQTGICNNPNKGCLHKNQMISFSSQFSALKIAISILKRQLQVQQRDSLRVLFKVSTCHVSFHSLIINSTQMLGKKMVNNHLNRLSLDWTVSGCGKKKKKSIPYAP